MRKPRLTAKAMEGLVAIVAETEAGDSDYWREMDCLPQVERACEWVHRMAEYRHEKRRTDG